jgi:hypothetical protein
VVALFRKKPRADAGADEPGAPIKDDETELPVAMIWRPTFEAIVACFVAGDWELTNSPTHVKRVPASQALELKESVANYGDVALVGLPRATWDSSVAMWNGERWEVLVDLWTETEGRSDLVLHAFVSEAEDGFDFEVHFIYVP